MAEEQAAQGINEEPGGDYIDFIERIAGRWFAIEEVHLLIADYLERVLDGEIDRLKIHMPPRTGKSQMCTIFFPAYYLGFRPSEHVIIGAHSAALADSFSEDVRDIIKTPEYQEFAPDTHLKPGTTSKSSWRTTMRGRCNALGVGAKAAGKGFHLAIVDDPISEQEAHSLAKKVAVNRWWRIGITTRQQAERSAMILVMTRWEFDDLAGHVDEIAEESGEKWTTLSIPAIIDSTTARLLNKYTERGQEIRQRQEDMLAEQEGREPVAVDKRYYKAGDSFCPGRWPLAKLKRQQATMSAAEWQALYQQTPLKAEGGILQKQWWRKYNRKGDDGNLVLPKFEYVVQSYDTAIKTGEANDYSARTTWGIWHNDDIGTYCALLLERLQQRMDFPALVSEVRSSAAQYDPDSVLVEDKASGQQLIQQMSRYAGFPITKITPTVDKEARAKIASPVLEQGLIYYPDKDWAEEVILQCARFPKDRHDDLVDSCTQFWTWFRNKFKLEFRHEVEDREAEEEDLKNSNMWVDPDDGDWYIEQSEPIYG